MSLRRRLILSSAAAVALAIVLASAIIYAAVADDLRDQIDETLQERVAGPGRAPPPGLRPDGPFTPPQGGEGVPLGQLINSHGEILDASIEGVELPVSEAARLVALGRSEAVFETVELDGAELRILTAPAGPGAAIQIARSLEEVNSTLSDLVLILGAVSIGGILLAGALGLLVARTALRPAASISAAAEEVARTRDLTRRIEVPGTDELARLAASFNEMMSALEESVGAQRRLVADASHELRTPLASLRTNIETLGRGAELSAGERGRIVEDVTAELEDMTELVGDVVELAREPGGRPLDAQEVRLDEIAAEQVERARRRGPALTFQAELEPTIVRGDPARLARAIWNLLDNAIKWAPAGSAVDVAVAEAKVTVRDRGPGFAEADLPHIFDRFYRAAEARGMSGSGLGLAIVARVAADSGAEVSAANAPGGGAVVEIRFPAGD